MAVNDVYQLNVNHILGGREISNVFYYRETTAGPAAPPQNASQLSHEFFVRIWSLYWDHVIAADVQLTAIWGRKVWPTLVQAGTILFTGEFGLRTGQAVPNGACVLMSAHDATNSPNFRRRMYISGLAEQDQRNSQVLTVQLSNWENFAKHVVQDSLTTPVFDPSVYKPCAFSKSLALEAGPQPWADLTFYKVTQSIRSQRGRNRRV
ncbi:unnamed protein product [marine sediment metagenome]|uniref:Uncharacterized protein n=1 Tax=marine sediment metagenome TaxID=412755 RepID=X0ZWE0_9ZZZZ